VIGFSLEAYEFKPARSRVLIGMKLLEPKLCRSHRQPEFICEQNKASLDPQRIHCDKAGWPRVTGEVTPYARRFTAGKDNFETSLTRITQAPYRTDNPGKFHLRKAEVPEVRDRFQPPECTQYVKRPRSLNGKHNARCSQIGRLNWRRGAGHQLQNVFAPATHDFESIRACPPHRQVG